MKRTRSPTPPCTPSIHEHARCVTRHAGTPLMPKAHYSQLPYPLQGKGLPGRIWALGGVRAWAYLRRPCDDPSGPAMRALCSPTRHPDPSRINRPPRGRRRLRDMARASGRSVSDAHAPRTCAAGQRWRASSEHPPARSCGCQDGVLSHGTVSPRVSTRLHDSLRSRRSSAIPPHPANNNCSGANTREGGTQTPLPLAAAVTAELSFARVPSRRRVAVASPAVERLLWMRC